MIDVDEDCPQCGGEVVVSDAVLENGDSFELVHCVDDCFFRVFDSDRGCVVGLEDSCGHALESFHYERDGGFPIGMQGCFECGFYVVRGT